MQHVRAYLIDRGILATWHSSWLPVKSLSLAPWGQCWIVSLPGSHQPPCTFLCCSRRDLPAAFAWASEKTHYPAFYHRLEALSVCIEALANALCPRSSITTSVELQQRGDAWLSAATIMKTHVSNSTMHFPTVYKTNYIFNLLATIKVVLQRNIIIPLGLVLR